MKEERVAQNTEKLSKNLNIDFKCNVWQTLMKKYRVLVNKRNLSKSLETNSWFTG